MTSDDDAVTALPWAELGGELGDPVGQGVGEALQVGRLLEADLGLDREREQPLAALGGGGPRRRHVAHEPRAVGEQRVGGEAVLRGGRADDGRLDDDRVGGRPHDALGAAAARALLDQLDQPAPLERAHVVVHALTRFPQPGRDLRGRQGLTQQLEHSLSQRRQRCADDVHTNRKSHLSNRRRRVGRVELGAGAWSYFGIRAPSITTGARSPAGSRPPATSGWPRGCRGRQAAQDADLPRASGVDDHNNPSLVFRRDGHIVVFFSPHSGRHLPRDQISRMRYRTSLHPYSIAEFGKVHTVDTNVPGGLGYTYPNPIQQRDKLWLFWRGGNWNPTFSYTRNRRDDWVPARELVYSATSSDRTRSTAATAATASTASSPTPTRARGRTSLHYARYQNSALYAASGRRLGTFASLPLHTSKLDHIYRYSDRGGRAWPHDIALDREGRPHVVYTRRLGGTRDTFYYAYFNGTRWVSRKIVEAGRRPARSPPAGRRSTMRIRASSTSRGASGPGTRSSSGSPPTAAGRGARGS